MITKQGQSFLDLVIQGTGSLQSAFSMALENDRSVSDAVETGEQIKSAKVKDKSITALFQKRLPATAPLMEIETITDQPEGIGQMIIEDTFIVY